MLVLRKSSKLRRPSCRPLTCARLRGLVGGCGFCRVGELSAGAAQGRRGKYQRIEPFIIPQLGEVKAYGGRLAVLALPDAAEEPGEAAGSRNGRGGRGSGVGG